MDVTQQLLGRSCLLTPLPCVHRRPAAALQPLDDALPCGYRRAEQFRSGFWQVAPDDHPTVQDTGKVMQDLLGISVLLALCSCWYRDAEDVAQQLLGSAGTLLGQSCLLPPHMLEAVRVKDANQQVPSRAAVQSVEFQPFRQLLVTAGLDKQLRLFKV